MILTYKCCPLVEPQREQTTSQGARAVLALLMSDPKQLLPDQRALKMKTHTRKNIFPKMTRVYVLGIRLVCVWSKHLIE